MKPRLVVSPFHDPYLNLALENYFLETLNPRAPLLFLYSNERSVVLGRFQNPWIETNPAQLGSIHLVRRQSGGGTVYHDRGNLNFSFITGQNEYDKTENLKQVCHVLQQEGIFLTINSRHDLTVNHKGQTYKVSGSAFRLKKDRVFHHGTLLINSETSLLKKAITPLADRIFLTPKGTESVRSKVINLAEIHPDLNVQSVLNLFRNIYEETKPDWQSLAVSESVEKDRKTLVSENWIYGKTPGFKQDISEAFGLKMGAVIIEIRHGVIHCGVKEFGFLNGISYGRSKTYAEVEDAYRKAGKPVSGNESFRRLLQILG